MSDDERDCPSCAETIKRRATRCRFCGIDLASAPSPRQPPLIQWPAPKMSDGMKLALAIVFILIIGLMLQSRMSNVDATADADVQPMTSTTAIDPERDARNAEERRKGFHCLSVWDGSNASLVKAVKLELRDPDSFQHIKTIIGPVTAKRSHPIKMHYRARNGFGGMDVDDAVAAVDTSTCEATVITSAEQLDHAL